ncbi:hypothetical protein ACF8PD_13575 [Vibrio plantisponsor]|uniref:hypothetical protein n=1 Tax=Vibrio plantisponsor TaxID=664643 RepID=UPI00370A863B
MSNDFYERKAEFKPFTTARSDDVRGEFDGIQSGFEKLPTPRQDGTKGFITAFTIVNPTEDNHPATKAMVGAENSKNTEQDVRLDQVENTLSGLGPVNGRYTTLRYVATAGQDTIVLPAQFGSLAYVFVNGSRKFQTVNFVYDVNTKTLTFLSALSLNDEVLVDVGVVPDAVLADLIAIQDDIASKHSDVQTWHSDVDQWQQQVANDKETTLDAKDTAVSARDETVLARNTVVALYLGPKSTAPTTDNDGNPLINGANYYNTTDGKTYVWWNGLWEVTNLSTTTTVAKTGTTGAALIPAGTTAERPDPTGLPSNVMALRYNTTTGEWEGVDADGNYSTIGGGGVPPYISQVEDFTVGKNKAYLVPMTDNVSKTITVGELIDKNWFAVSFMDWGDIDGLYALLNFTDVPLVIRGIEYTTYRVLEPCVMEFERINGYWKVVGVSAGAGSYYALEQRVGSLEGAVQQVYYNAAANLVGDAQPVHFSRIGNVVVVRWSVGTARTVAQATAVVNVPEGYRAISPNNALEFPSSVVASASSSLTNRWVLSGNQLLSYGWHLESTAPRFHATWLTNDPHPTGDEI